MDPYSLLGITPGAEEGELKRAFRRLAMRWHPDRNPAPDALEHFKALRAAYETLLADLTDGGAEPSGDDEDIDPGEEAAADAAAPAGPRGADRRQTLVLSIEEACLGAEKIVVIADETVCAHCHGSGETALSHSRLCATCHGSGRLRGAHGLVSCAVCNGRGYVNKDACPDCAGSGRQGSERRLAVRVPPGMLPGDELRLEGEGEAHEGVDGRPGDLRLIIELAPHPLFRRDGRDLLVTRPVSLFRLLAGGELVVPVPGGVRRVALPGDLRIRQLRVDGAGLPGRGGRPAGALVVDLDTVMPDTVDAGLRTQLGRLDDALRRKLDAHLPALAEWEANWLPED